MKKSEITKIEKYIILENEKFQLEEKCSRYSNWELRHEDDVTKGEYEKMEKQLGRMETKVSKIERSFTREMFNYLTDVLGHDTCCSYEDFSY